MQKKRAVENVKTQFEFTKETKEAELRRVILGEQKQRIEREIDARVERDVDGNRREIDRRRLPEVPVALPPFVPSPIIVSTKSSNNQYQNSIEDENRLLDQMLQNIQEQFRQTERELNLQIQQA